MCMIKHVCRHKHSCMHIQLTLEQHAFELAGVHLYMIFLNSKLTTVLHDPCLVESIDAELQTGGRE